MIVLVSIVSISVVSSVRVVQLVHDIVLSLADGILSVLVVVKMK